MPRTSAQLLESLDSLHVLHGLHILHVLCVPYAPYPLHSLCSLSHLQLFELLSNLFLERASTSLADAMSVLADRGALGVVQAGRGRIQPTCTRPKSEPTPEP